MFKCYTISHEKYILERNLMNKENYLFNPCYALSIPYWKNKVYKKPENIDIFHQSQFETVWIDTYQEVNRYFRLLHPMTVIEPMDATIEVINVSNDINLLVTMINASYVEEKISVDKKQIMSWMNHPTYDASLWVKISKDDKIIASGIAEFDAECNEGIIEWVQVLPAYQRQGLGKKIVDALLCQLSSKASFVTVSGRINNHTNPEK